MSESLRYQKQEVIDYLAGQYVAGQMTPLVLRRVEALRKEIPQLDNSIAALSDAFAEVHDVLPAPAFSHAQQDKIWAKIAPTTEMNKQKAVQTKTSFWDNLFVWRGLGISSLAALFVMISFFGLSPNATTASPAYFASMSPASANLAQAQPVYVISIYKASDEQPPEMVLQWVKNNQDKSHNAMIKKTELHIWSEDKKTNALAYIGMQPKANEPIRLSKASWKAITESKRLLVTNSAKAPDAQSTLFTGLCLQLKSWKT